MKFQQILLGAAVFLTACSSPKYVYHFDQFDYNSEKKTENSAGKLEDVTSPLEIKQQTLTASSQGKTIAIENSKETSASSAVAVATEKYKAMSKTGKREFRKELKKEFKSYKKERPKSVASVNATKVFDKTVALAILFGGAGIVLIMLASVSNVFWVLGAISLVIGAVFFIQWVANGNG